jgi:hypothetical protein
MAKSMISERMPANLLAVFVMDTNETELTTPFGNSAQRYYGKGSTRSRPNSASPQ